MSTHTDLPIPPDDDHDIGIGKYAELYTRELCPEDRFASREADTLAVGLTRSYPAPPYFAAHVVHSVGFGGSVSHAASWKSHHS